ncbi:Carbohydrate binding domain (family 32) [Popillia japonica]|uniref:Carbohydrate binding domain (Family 32) n=1 Tax=Popillia japonica TaxID=7064 RepID=A0AAW1K2I1_POPJA
MQGRVSRLQEVNIPKELIATHSWTCTRFYCEECKEEFPGYNGALKKHFYEEKRLHTCSKMCLRCDAPCYSYILKFSDGNKFLVLSTKAASLCGQYKIPKPTVIVYKPRGLEVFIPDDNGINLVVFYISVNKDLNDFPSDYMEYAVAQQDGKWMFSRDDIKLTPGDVVYHKIYVQRYKRGYLHRGTPFVVTDRIKRPTVQETSPQNSDDCFDTPPISTTNPPPESHQPIPSQSTTPQKIPLYDDCSTSLNTVLKVLSTTQKELEDLRSNQEILIEIASAQPHTLQLHGSIIDIAEPKVVVESVLLEKLDTLIKVKSAVKTGTSTLNVDEDVHILASLETLDRKRSIQLFEKEIRK